MTYEDHLTRLEQILSQLESHELDLDTAMALFEQGIEHLREATTGLARAEERVKLLVERRDGRVDLDELRD